MVKVTRAGFDSWAALKEHAELSSLEGASASALIDEFLQHSCIFSGGPLDFPQKWRRTERILARNPNIATANIHTAAVCGELEHLRRLLREDPSLVSQKAGPQGWEPLLYLCYGRLPNERAASTAYATAEVLLNSGADPNTFFVTRDEWKLRFNALTGVMGRGEMGAPEHPQADALARLLLERGANPNDSQGLYNTHLEHDETKWLELLFQHGLKASELTNWDTEKAGDERVGDYLVAQAAGNGHIQRLRCLLEHGADANAKSRYNGLSCYQNAVLAGKLEVAALLLEHGAKREPLEGRHAFVAACNSCDRAEAERLLAGHVEYIETADPLIDAVRVGRLDVAKLLLDLGMDPNGGQHGHRPLNSASRNKEACELLLSYGANPRLRAFGGTPQTWARLAGDLQMARWQAEKSRYLLDAVVSGHGVLAQELLDEDPSRINEKSPSGDTVLHELPADPEQAQPLLELLLLRGADPSVKNEAGQTAIEKLIANGSDDVADLLEAAMPKPP